MSRSTKQYCSSTESLNPLLSTNLLKTPGDRLEDVHLASGVLDLYETDRTFVQALFARAWNVTDGFNGLVVMPNNPLTGDPVGAPVIMHYTHLPPF